MQERLEREKKDDNESATLKIDLLQEIEQLTQILQFVKEAKDNVENSMDYYIVFFSFLFFFSSFFFFIILRFRFNFG
jgi:hypothetical protein